MIRKFAADRDPDVPAVLAGHFTLGGSVLSGSERPSLIAHEPTFRAQQLAVPPVDYVALGHIHCHQDCAPSDSDVPVVDGSSIKRVSLHEKGDPKGFVLETTNGTLRRTAYEFEHTPARRFGELRADLRQGDEPKEALLRCISGGEGVADAVVRLRYQA